MGFTNSKATVCPLTDGGAVVLISAAEATDNLVLIWVDQGFSGENFSRVIQKLCAALIGCNLSE